MIWYELTRWWAYRGIRHPKMKIYTTALPAFLAVVLTCVTLVLPVPPLIVGDGGIVESIISVLALLPGFYIAALAAISTFHRPEMDEVMPRPAPTILMKFENSTEKVELTRRMFLSYLFSYLAILTLVLVCIGYLVVLVSPSLNGYFASIEEYKYGKSIIVIVKGGFLFCLYFWCSSIFISTLHGVYFMTEKMHQPN